MQSESSLKIEEHRLHHHHQTLIEASAITNEVASARGYRTVSIKAELKALGFGEAQRHVPALLIPIWSVTGEVATHQLRPDVPRIKNGKALKYETPVGTRMVLDVPPTARLPLANPAIPLFVTEGARKADAAVSQGLCCIALLGVWNFRGTNEHGGVTALADWELIALKGRTVYICFDSDVVEKAAVRLAMKRLREFLKLRGAEVRVIYLPAGAGEAKVGLDDYFAAGGSVDSLLHLASSELKDEPESKIKPERKSQAKILVELGSEAELFRTPSNEVYSSFNVGEHIETWKLESRGFRQWLECRFYECEGRPPSRQATQDALGVLAGLARFGDIERKVFTRLASLDGTTYLDLCDSEWRVVAISASGWCIFSATDVPVRFRRSMGMLALPEPLSGGNIMELHNFVNVRDDNDFILLVSFLVAALRGDATNFPILSLTGEQGSAKSTTARVCRALFDPNEAALRSDPRTARDLAIAANNSWCVAYDNLSSLPIWLADALCRLSTGGGFATRKLYENEEEAIFDSTRPIILNGIEDIATRADLLDRAIVLHLPTISESKRMRERIFWKEFEAKRPFLLGALCTAVSTALRNITEVNLPKMPRMADFAEWATAAESAIGYEQGAFFKAYTNNRRAANDLALEASPISSTLISWLEANVPTTVTITLDSLLAILTDSLDDPKKIPTWFPKTGRALAAALARASPNLRAAGWDITTASREPGSGRTRRNITRLEQSCDSSSQSSQSSQAAKHTHNQTEATCEDSCEVDSINSAYSPLSSQEKAKAECFYERREECEEEMQDDSTRAYISDIQGEADESEWMIDRDVEYNELAARLQYDGNLPREEAELLAHNLTKV